MNLNELEIGIANWNTDANELKSIRSSVFIDEQNVPVELEWDGLDDKCTHFIVRHNSAAIATARMKPDGQIGRMAILKAYRGLGVGTQLMTTILNHAKKSGMNHLYLHAQTQVIGFYENFDFTSEGEEFMDAGIPHRAMSLKICYK